MATTKSGIEGPVGQTKSIEAPTKVYPGSKDIGKGQKSGAGNSIEGPASKK